MQQVTVIDSLMGTGKTSWAIQYMNEHPDDNFMYITPLLTEVDRVMKNTTETFFTPKNFGKGKLDDFKHIIGDVNIVSTHELFKMIDKECKDSLSMYDYILVLDECLDVVEQVDISPNDIGMLKHDGRIKIDEKHHVHWIGGDYTGKFEYIRDYANTNQLLCIDENFFIWQYDPDVFKKFKHVYIMTYMFNRSVMSRYFKLWNIEYETKSVMKNNNGKYDIVDYYEPDLSHIRDLITIYDGSLNTNFNQKFHSLSVNWFSNTNNKTALNQIKNNIHNLYTNVWKINNKDFMWSTFTFTAEKLSYRGYLYNPNAEDNSNKGFVALNARGTNAFSNKHYLVYACNLYPTPDIGKYFSTMSYSEIKMESIDYALTNMVQWIWRSAIRNDEPITIYIPSKRMRRILETWLGYDKVF